MSYGRIARGAAGALLRASPVGGAVSKAGKLVSSIFGGGPPDRKASYRLRGIIRNARLGKPEAINRLKMMATNQGSKFANINRQAREAYASLSIGAAPAGIMGKGGGTIGRVPRSRRAVSRRSPAAPARRRRRSARSGWVLYKGKRYSPKQARLFVPRLRGKRRAR